MDELIGDLLRQSENHHSSPIVDPIATPSPPAQSVTRPKHFPGSGSPADQVLAELEAKRSDDVRWNEGRTFGLVFDGGDEVRYVAERAAQTFLHENALNTAAFPSLGAIQSELCAWTADLLHGPEGTAGFVTSGGTESILCAVEAARERAHVERGVHEPEIVLATSAHAAFHKAAHLFGLRPRVVDVTVDWTPDLDAMADAVNDQTALVVASAPQYPQGVVDPVEDIAQMAVDVGASCHVDACMGAFVLPFAAMEEPDMWAAPPWDLAVEGVTSISADIHKLGYAPKGVSVLLHRSKALRRYQTFVFDGWLGGRYVTPNLQGTRSGLPMAAAWAVVRFLGTDGYRQLVRRTISAADQIRTGVRAVDGLTVPSGCRHHLLSITADPCTDHPLDPFSVGDAMAARGWHHDRQGPPDGLHLTVSAGNAPVVKRWLSDLAEAVDDVRSSSGTAPVNPATVAYSTLE